MLPQDVFDLIAIFSGQSNVIHTLKHQLTPQVYNSFYQKNVSLVYGQVQSGKTAMIFQLIRNSPLPCVLIIQNSLLVLKQYISRFKSNHIDFQTVNDSHFHAKVVIILHNSSQYNKFMLLKPPPLFSLFMDESDLTHRNPIIHLATNQFHITATPFKYKHIFDKFIRIPIPHNYFGIHNVIFQPKTFLQSHTDYTPIIHDFTSNNGGILLINEFSFVSDMKKFALLLSNQFHLPFIVLSTIKYSYFKGKVSIIRIHNIQHIIDSFSHKHIVIIANRMSNRGLSFTSSDFKRHITHQVSGNFNNITSFLQKSRIFGIYNDSPILKMFIHPNLFQKIHSYKLKVSFKQSILKDTPDNLYFI